VPPFKRFRLRTGVEVLLAEFHELPLIELHLVLKTGGAANPVGSAGLADLTANMLDEGTKTRSALDIAEQIASLGSVLGSGASWDASTLTLATIARNFDAALAIWADVLLHPAFSEKELARVRDNLATAVARRRDSPPTVASLTLARVLYGDKHPYAWPQTGTEESLAKLGTAEVRRFYETYYHPANATIIVAGDVTEAQLRRKLETALRDWKPARVPAVKLSSPPVAEKKRIFLIDKPGAPQSSIRVGLVGVKRTDPDYFPIVLMNQVLGGSFYRLDMDLRERLQWTYGARSSFEMRRTPGPFSAGGEFVAAHTADAVAEILKEMRLMSTTEVSDEELARAKDNFIRSFPARFATRGSTAGVLAELAVYGLPDRFLTDYAKNIQSVTKAEIRRVAAKYLLTERAAIVVVGDRASQEAGLARLGPIEVRDLDGGPLVAHTKSTGSTTESPASKSEGGGAQD
jgi:predicted Zn-dependent peptidase